MATVGYGTVPFDEQIEYFRRKKGVLTESWLDVWESEHDLAFMVAGANRDDLLADFNAAISRAIEDGATLEQFRQEFDRIVDRYGWDYNGSRNWRSRVIYETNMRQSYNAGRWTQLQALKKARPYWRYRHNDAVEHPRPHHQALDGLVLLADDPWWLLYFPANGWGCQCYVEALNERDLKRLGKDGPDTAPAIEYETRIVGQRSPGGPRAVQTPVGIDPGFAYAPGQPRNNWPQRRGGPQTPPALRDGLIQATQHALTSASRLPAAPAAHSVAELLAKPRAVDALQAGLMDWHGTAKAGRFIAGALQPTAVQALQAAGAVPATATVMVDVIEALAGVPDDHLGDVVRDLASPHAVLLNVATGVVRFVLSMIGRQRLVMDVRLADAGQINRIQSTALLDPSQLGGSQWQLIDGVLTP